MFVKAQQWHPLSPSQKRIWHLENKYGCEVNNNNALIHLQGIISPKLLEEAVLETIQRHDSLRLQFMEERGEALQRVADKFPQYIPVHDFRNESSEAYALWLDRLIHTQPGIQQEQLYVFEIALKDSSTTVLFLKLHHIIADGWSIQPIFNTIIAVYAELANRVPELPKSATGYSYLDSVREEYDYIESNTYIRDKAFWTRQLSDLPESFLTTASDNTAARSTRYILPPELVGKIQGYCQSHHVQPSLFYSYLMYLYIHLTTTHNDLLLGIPFLNRSGTESKQQIAGMFSNYLPLRLMLKDEETVLESLRQAGKQFFLAYKHQRFPLEDMVRDIPRLREHSGLFQVTVNYYNQQFETDVLGNSFYVEELHGGHQSYALQFKIKEWNRFGQTELSFEFDYKTAYFNEAKINAMYRSLMHLMNLISECSSIRLSELSLLSEQEKNQAIYSWNNTTKQYPADSTLTRLVCSQARQAPDRVALEFEGAQLTYRELEERASVLAGELIRMGVGQGQIVGLLTCHSFESIIGMLAIMKSGASYLPLDSQYPMERIAYIVQDANVKLVLTNKGLHKLLPKELAYMNLDIPNNTPVLVPNAEQDKSDPSGIAYVIYTSGSTGKPKGVAISHRSAVNYCWWAKQAYVRKDSDIFAIYSSLAFDLTVTSIFVPLIAGNKAIIYKQTEPGEFVLSRIIRDQAANIIKLTPAHLEIAVKEAYPQPAVRRFIVGGERFGCVLADQTLSAFGDIELYNEYGPTETTVGCMIYLYNGQHHPSGSVPIGRPIDNMRIYLLDQRLNPVAVEHEGEIYIAGDGLAAGYHNRPALNEERFLPDPFVPASFMYKSGDLARFDADGNLIYISRMDEQLNLRGYRIEGGEIESVISSCEGIDQVCVTVKEDASGHQILCCYFTGSPHIKANVLKRKLEEHLLLT